MKTFAHFTIRQKLAAGYAVMYLSVLIISVYAVIQLYRFDRLINTALRVDSEILKNAEYLMNSLLTQASNNQKFMITGDVAFKRLFGENAEEFLKRLDALERWAQTDKQRDAIAVIRASYQRYTAVVNKEFQTEGLFNRTPDSSKQELIAEISTAIGTLNEITQQLLDRKMLYSQQVTQTGTRIALLITIIAVAAGIGFGVIIIRSLYNPLRRLKEGTQDIARGNFNARIPIESRDELGELSAAFNQMCDRLRELDQLKSDFIANITHDLKTPLASITEATQLLREGVGGAVSPEQQHLLQIIQEDTARLIRLIDGMIDLTKMESGLMQYNVIPADIAPVIAEAVEAMQLLAESKRVTLTATVVPGVPPLLIDREKMGQALINLLSNAIKFTPAGGSVCIKAQTVHSYKTTADYPAGTQGNFVEISVTDTGMGIAAEDLPKIFDKFFQGRGGAQQKGSGLGLAIAQHIIQAHGGSIRAESEHAHGATFYILLPVHTPSGDTSAAA